MTSSPHGLYVQGYTRATMDGTKRRKPARGSQSQKTVLSSDCRLQPACSEQQDHPDLITRRGTSGPAIPGVTRGDSDPALVGQGGFEPPTPRLSSVCSNQLSY